MQPYRIHFQWKSALFISALLAALVATRADAQPYDFLAVYEPVSSNGQSHAVRLDASDGALLPDGGENHKLDRLVVKFKSDAISTSLLASFSFIEFTVKIGAAQPMVVMVDTKTIEKLSNGEKVLVSWAGDGEKEALSKIDISVRAIFSGKVLCAQEQVLLARKAESKPVQEAEVGKKQAPDEVQPSIADQLVPSDSSVNAKVSLSASSKEILSTPVLFDINAERRLKAESDGPYILWSFCPKSQVSGDTWRELASTESRIPKDERAKYMFHKKAIDEDPQQLKVAHKQALSKMVKDQLNESFPSFNKAEIDLEAKDWDNSLVYVGSKRKFAIIKSAGSLLLMEEFSEDPKRVSEIVDQDSEVSLFLERSVCSQMPPGMLWNAPWTFELEVPDKKDPSKTQRVKLDVEYRDGCSRKLLAKWADYIKQRVIFRIIYRVPEREDIVILKVAFEIYNIGLITTLPVFSEINSAIQGTSLRDVEATSSIPISFAIPVANNAKASSAVTFPFTVSVNTRTFPTLAEYFALAPSISLIAGGSEERGETSQGPSLGVGVGVNMARAFHFGYTWVPSDGRRYILVGISVPELLPLFSGIR